MLKFFIICSVLWFQVDSFKGLRFVVWNFDAVLLALDKFYLSEFIFKLLRRDLLRVIPNIGVIFRDPGPETNSPKFQKISPGDRNFFSQNPGNLGPGPEAHSPKFFKSSPGPEISIFRPRVPGNSPKTDTYDTNHDEYAE